jgi:nucleotidyltransferase substrate binding protein (TIGR01987 family)
MKRLLLVGIQNIMYNAGTRQIMTQTNDIRWKQRFNKYTHAWTNLSAAIDLANQRPLSDLERLGLIHWFRHTHELAWNVLKEYLEEQGFNGFVGSKNVTREAFSNALITDGEVWMDMIKARYLTFETYKLEVAQSLSADIVNRFSKEFSEFASHFGQRFVSE